MVEVKVEFIGQEKLERALGNLAKNQRKPLMRKLGAAMVGIVDRNFEAEGRPTKWKKRSAITNKTLGALGMIQASYTKKYQNAKRARTKIKYLRGGNLKVRGNLILHGTGDLKKSITFVAEDSRVIIGPGGGVPYARIHQLGGVIVPKKAKALAVPYGYGRILRLKKVTIPARPYLVVPRSEAELLKKIASSELQREAERGRR